MGEKPTVPTCDKISTYLNPEQRYALTQIPSDLSDRDIARHYTFTEKERELINRRRRASNRLGCAVQLTLLKFPGRTLMEVKEVPRAMLRALAPQLFFGRLRELRDRAFEDQMHRASCLHLIMAAIAAWNTVYLTEAITSWRKRGEDIPEATVAHIAPLG